MQRKLIEFIFSRIQQKEVQEGRSADFANAITGFLDEIPGGFFIYRNDEEQSIIYANRSMVEIMGCENMEEFKELTGGSFRGIVHPDDWLNVKASIDLQIAGHGEALDYVEYRIKRKDGSVRWVEDYGHFIHDEKIGDVYYVFISDATDKIESDKEERVRRLEVIEGLSINYEAIIYADLASDRIISYRESERTKHQFSGENITSYLVFIDNYVKVWVHPDDQPLVEQTLNPINIQERLKEERTFYINYRCVRTGFIQHIQLRVVNVGKRGSSEIVIGFRNVGEELHREMQQRQVLMDALNEANLAAHARNSFLSNMSHDMRTPLNAIFGYTSLAEHNVHNPEAVKGYLEKIRAASEEMLSLTEKVLQLTYAETEGNALKEEACDLVKIVHSVGAQLMKKAANKNIEFTVDANGINCGLVNCDANKVEQILFQLADNAVKYTKAGGKVEIKAEEGKRQPSGYRKYRFTVFDTGIGIGKKILPNIFNAFEREYNSTASGIFGTGLGLTIAKRFTELMGGSIEVKSEVDKGSCFTVTLSFSEAKKEAPKAEGALERIKEKKILIVEDNEINLDIEREILEEMGFSVESAENGKVAVEKLTAQPEGYYAVVLMDIQMPVMDGWQATEAIRKLENPHLARIPIIALSANAFESDIRRSMQSGMDAHLPKPIDVEELMRTMSEIVDSRPTEK